MQAISLGRGVVVCHPVMQEGGYSIDPPERAEVTEVYENAIGLVVPHHLARGDWVTIESDDFSLQAQVEHVAERPDGRWFLGCAFSERLTEGQVEAMGCSEETW